MSEGHKIAEKKRVNKEKRREEKRIEEKKKDQIYRRTTKVDGIKYTCGSLLSIYYYYKFNAAVLLRTCAPRVYIRTY